jgi:hypothetical protein
LDPLRQSALLFVGIFTYICIIDKNVPQWLYLKFIAIPGIALMRLVWWVRLYPRLQWDRFQLFLRMRRKPSVTGGVGVSERHLKMAKQLMEELQNGQTSSGRDDGDLQ